LKPGETRWGVAIFPPVDPEMDHMTVVIEGLSNANNFMLMHRPVLCLDYTRLGDEFYTMQDKFEFVSKYWHYQWMWWEETRMGIPERIVVNGPSGNGEFPVWVFDLTIRNSRGEDRNLVIKRIAVVLGQDGSTDTPIKVFDNIPVVVRIFDDGDSSIYKYEAFKQGSRNVTAVRFLNGSEPIQKDREFTIPVAIEEGAPDIDWDDVYAQVLRAITPSSSALYEAIFIGATNPNTSGSVSENDMIKLRQAMQEGLTQEMKDRIKKEVLDQIKPAMQQAFDSRRFTLEITGESGLSIGTFRIVRDFIRRTPIDKNLIKSWSK